MENMEIHIYFYDKYSEFDWLITGMSLIIDRNQEYSSSAGLGAFHCYLRFFINHGHHYRPF